MLAKLDYSTSPSENAISHVCCLGVEIQPCKSRESSCSMNIWSPCEFLLQISKTTLTPNTQGTLLATYMASPTSLPIFQLTLQISKSKSHFAAKMHNNVNITKQPNPFFLLPIGGRIFLFMMGEKLLSLSPSY